MSDFGAGMANPGYRAPKMTGAATLEYAGDVGNKQTNPKVGALIQALQGSGYLQNQSPQSVLAGLPNVRGQDFNGMTNNAQNTARLIYQLSGTPLPQGVSSQMNMGDPMSPPAQPQQPPQQPAPTPPPQTGTGGIGGNIGGNTTIPGVGTPPSGSGIGGSIGGTPPPAAPANPNRPGMPIMFSPMPAGAREAWNAGDASWAAFLDQYGLSR